MNCHCKSQELFYCYVLEQSRGEDHVMYYRGQQKCHSPCQFDLEKKILLDLNIGNIFDLDRMSNTLQSGTREISKD